MSSLLSVVKKMINKKINQIKSGIMRKIMSNSLKKTRNTPKRISNRILKYLENNSCVIATKGVISTPKIVINKPQIVAKPEVVTMPKIAIKSKKSEIVKKNYRIYDEHKNRVIRQLKHLFDSKKRNT